MTTLPLVKSDDLWVPNSCTLPTEEQPLRIAEFDHLLTSAVHHGELIEADHLRLSLTPEPAVAAQVAELAARESSCCSFFTFTLTIAPRR